MPLPTMTPVQSSNVTAIGHDGQHTYVAYKSGVYRYADVPADKHAQLASAASIGKHLNQHFKGQHNATKLDDVVVVLEDAKQ